MEKRKFLYYNLNNVENNKLNIIYNYISTSDIDHNENQNGLLINLSKLTSDNPSPYVSKNVSSKYFFSLFNLPPVIVFFPVSIK